MWQKLVRTLAILGGLGIALAAAVTVYVVFWSGLRATAEPTAIETRLARTVRNVAVPRRDRDAATPLQPTAANVQSGRSAFLTQCAGCHGYTRTDLTPVGRNLYPRAPNLASAGTQALSDGTLHYIIENGVPLTGMPAWSRPHQPSDAWQLVLFIRSIAAAPPSPTPSAASMAHYVGSKACESCHADEYRRWAATPMANVVRQATLPGVLPDLSSNTVFPFDPHDVAFVYGSLWKQRFFKKIGDDYYPLPVQWEVANKKWSKYFVASDWWAAFYPPDNMQRPTGPTCDGCHSVGYDIHTKQVAEWNVGCERCHGPGSEHVSRRTRDTIVNPGRMDAVAASDTCIQCHSQGRPKTSPIEGRYYDWPVGYSVGQRLADSWLLEERTLGETDFYYFADGTSHKNRMQGNDFTQSLMYRRGLTCFSCHDVHGTGNYAQLIKPANAICLDCHGPSSPNGPRAATIEAHTHHKAGSSGTECVACHMPAIQTEGVPNTNVHAHTFKVIPPEATDRYKMPNPCTGCHTDKTTSWARNALNGWPGVSPWSR
jgi:predicted CXXCH cytochrome family protein